jgi:hypothetical protein
MYLATQRPSFVGFKDIRLIDISYMVVASNEHELWVT